MRSGRYATEPWGYRAFMPAPLPPDAPPLDLPRLTKLNSEADQALGRLDGISTILPNPELFVAMYVRREAVLSSQIEGTQASLDDLLDHDEAAPDAHFDVGDIVNYVAAMNAGIARLPTLPLSLRLIREIHGVLMNGVRGQHKDPGEFRRIQNWIGPKGATIETASFVPPPPPVMLDALAQLEIFLHDHALPPLLHAGLCHAQFETIHPFLDGNGRVGRLLITFLLFARGALAQPLLYLSHYFKKHRQEYYDRLQAVRDHGRWEEWLEFFLRGVRDVAIEATSTSRTILDLRTRHRDVLQRAGRSSGSLLRLHDLLFETPQCSAASVQRLLKVTAPTANKLLAQMVASGILIEVTGGLRNRRFRYAEYVKLFSDVT